MVAGLVTGVLGIGGAIIGSNASRNAAQTVQQSTDQQTALYREIYNDTVNRQQPFYNTGVAANAAAAELLGVNVQGNSTQGYQPSQGYSSYLNNNRGYVGQNALSSSNYNRSYGSPYSIPKTQNSIGAYGQNPLATNSNNIGRVNPSIIANGDGTYGPTTSGAVGSQTFTPSNPLAAQGQQQQQQQTTSNGQPIYQNAQLTALQQSPGYQFRMQEGQNQLETGAAARGGLLSGQHIKNATQYAQDYASNEYNTRFNQLQALSGGGQTAANAAQNAGSNYAAGTSNALASNASYAAQQQQQRGSIYGDALGGIGGIIAGGL